MFCVKSWLEFLEFSHSVASGLFREKLLNGDRKIKEHVKNQGERKMKKYTIAILLTAMIILPLFAEIKFAYGGLNTDPASWYTTVPGVLNSDYYSLYPYDTTKNLTIGMSKFGELIDGKTGVGLRYGTPTNFIDPFGSGPYVPEFEWNQGWVIDITYTYESQYSRVWAFALYSDSYKSPDSIGGTWKLASAPESTTVLGGRKYGGYRYNGTAYLPIGYVSTQDFTVLYNGPRLFVGLSNNTIWEDPTTPLVRVYLTFVFEKDKKYVTVLKDIKLIDTRKGTGTLQVEFSNRGEWDLGKATSPISYAHFFDDQYTSMHDGWQPFYGGDHPAYYDVAQIISTIPSGYVGFAAFWPSLTSKYVEAFADTSRAQRLSTMETWKAATPATASQTVFILTQPANPLPIAYPRGSGVWSDAPMVFVNGVLRPASATAPNGYVWSSAARTVTFNTGLAAGDLVWIIYKRYVHQTDMSESGVPYVIGEWDFDLKHSLDPTTTQFRGVTVYGIVDNHDASDDPKAPVIDREAQYQLNEVFNPWDLTSAVEKSTWRNVDFFSGNGTKTTFALAYTPLDPATAIWDGYASFAEDVLVNGALQVPTSVIPPRIATTYTYTLYDTGLGYWAIHFITPPPVGVKNIKVLYSSPSPKFVVLVGDSYGHTAPSGLSIFASVYGGDPGRDTIMGNADDLDYASALRNVANSGIHVLAVDYSSGGLASTEFYYDALKTEGRYYNGSTAWGASIASYIAGAVTSTWGYGDVTFVVDLTGSMGGAKLVDVQTKLASIVTSLSLLNIGFGVGTFEDYNNSYTSYGYSAQYGGALDYPWKMAQDITMNRTLVTGAIGAFAIGWGADDPEAYTRALYESQFFSWRAAGAMGRYEWGIVGRDAASIDSAGLSMVTAAFKDKQVEYGLAGADMNNTDPKLAMPSVMSKFSAGTTKAAYKDAKGRAALKDDYCTTWPVASSNMIAEGGPTANLLAYYGNDLTSAFAGIGDFTNYTPWKNEIVALSCWSRNAYVPNATMGYAVVSTFLDLNGTVGFLVWGYDGRDTYQVSKWFMEDGIYEMQEFPPHVTSVIVQIDYTVHNPLISNGGIKVVEALGTISETGFWDYVGSGWVLKGGIHPDP